MRFIFNIYYTGKKSFKEQDKFVQAEGPIHTRIEGNTLVVTDENLDDWPFEFNSHKAAQNATKALWRSSMHSDSENQVYHMWLDASTGERERGKS